MLFHHFSVRRFFGRLLPCFALAAVPALATPVVYLPDDVNYTFENLTVDSNLVGQDNWLNYTGPNNAFQIKTGTGYNTTKVVQQGTSTSTHVAIRPNDAAYSFPAHTGGKVAMQFDFRWDDTATGSSTRYYMGLGAPSTSSSDPSKVTELNERAPGFGVNNNQFFIYRLAGSLNIPWTYTINSTVNTRGDWLRVKFEIDPNYVFDDGSVGAGHIYYYNLTKAAAGSPDANTAFQRLSTTPSDPTPIKLHLNNMYSDVQDPATWNTMVLVKSIDTKAAQMDNLMPYIPPYVYNFEHIRNGATLSSNDNWLSGSNMTVGARGVTSFSDYPTKVASLGNSTNIAIRPNDERFSFPRHSASDASALMQFDFQYQDIAGNYYFGLSTDSLEDVDAVGSHLNERAPAFGVANRQFIIRELADGGNGHSDVFNYAITGNEAAIGDWIRLRHVMDFTANWNPTREGFDGAGRLFYQNLTRGDTEFIELTTTAVNLRITDMWADVRDPSIWDTMVFVQSGATTGVQITNLIANVPEPSSLLLAILAVFGFGYARPPRARG